MIAPLAAFSAVYTSRARALAASSPVRAPSSEAATGTTAPSQPERTPPPPPLTGTVNKLSEASLLLAAQEGGKVGKSPPDLAKVERKAVSDAKKLGQEARRGGRAHTAAPGPYEKIGAYGKAAAAANGYAVQGLSLSV